MATAVFILRLAAIFILLASCPLASRLDPTACLDALADEVLTSIANETEPVQQLTTVAGVLTSYLTGCLYAITTSRPLRLLAPPDVVLVGKQLGDAWTNISGVSFSATSMNMSQIPAEIVQQSLTPEIDLYDGIFLDAGFLPETVQQGALLQLDNIVQGDAAFNWSDIDDYHRTQYTQYANHTYVMAVGADVLMMWYRRDLFALHSIDVPQTWDELLQLAAQWNGTDWDGDGVPDYSLCYDGGSTCQSTVDMNAIAQSYMQYQGPSQGTYLDPENLDPLTNNPGMAEALRLYAALRKFGDPSQQNICTEVVAAFVAGRCLVTLKGSSVMKAANLLPYSRVKGVTAAAPLPGSYMVLDRDSNGLMACNPQQCPYAQQTKLQDGSQVWVNRAWRVRPTYTAAISSNSNPHFQDVTWSFYKFLLSPQVQISAILSMMPGVGPIRKSQLSSDNVPVWVAAGFDAADVGQYLEVAQEGYSSGNVVLGLRIPCRDPIKALISQGADNATAGMAVNEIMTAMTQGIADALNNCSPYSQAELLELYDTAITYSADGLENQTAIAPELLSIAAVAPVVGCLLLAVFVAWRYRRRRGIKGSSGALNAPQMGPDLTLVVTDIQGSTKLWEVLPDVVMDAALKQHHALVRRLLYKHDGYESATEGDSFIIAFHTPKEALEFALDLQGELVKEAWPPALLLQPECAVVYRKPTKHAQQADPGTRGGDSGVRNGEHRDERQNRRWSSSCDGGRRMSLGSAPPSGVPSSPRNNTPQPTNSPSHSTMNAQPTVNNYQATNGHPPVDRQVTFRTSISSSSTDKAPTVYSHTPTVWSQFERGLQQDAAAGGPSDLATYKDKARADWTGATAAEAGAVLAFSGLRVRVGIHTGMDNESDINKNQATQRFQYGGQCLAMAKAVSDAGVGGMVLLSDSVFKRLPEDAALHHTAILHLGQHRLQDNTHDTHLYIALQETLRCRLPLFGPIRTTVQRTPSVLEAPVGYLTLVHLHIVGVQTLLEWNVGVALESLSIFEQIAIEELDARGGYLAECDDGRMMVAFVQPHNAILWALECHARMREAAWPQPLLDHELCEELMMPQQPDEGEETQEVVVFRGLRMKICMDSGMVRSELRPSTGRMRYRGRVAQRTARMMPHTATGQVVCSKSVWAQSSTMPEIHQQHITAVALGVKDLGAANDKLELFCCRVSTNRRASQSYGSAGGVVPVLQRAPHTHQGGTDGGIDALDNEVLPRNKAFSMSGTLSTSFSGAGATLLCAHRSGGGVTTSGNGRSGNGLRRRTLELPEGESNYLDAIARYAMSLHQGRRLTQIEAEEGPHEGADGGARPAASMGLQESGDLDEYRHQLSGCEDRQAGSSDHSSGDDDAGVDAVMRIYNRSGTHDGRGLEDLLLPQVRLVIRSSGGGSNEAPRGRAGLHEDLDHPAAKRGDYFVDGQEDSSDDDLELIAMQSPRTTGSFRYL